MQPINPQDDDVVDIEEFVKAGKPIPAGKKYRIKIEKEKYVVKVPSMTGAEILTLAGKVPVEKFILQQKIGKLVERIALTDIVSFIAKGIERFMVVPREVTEGDGPAVRMDFAILPDDELYLNSLGLRWDAILESNIKRIVIRDWPLPAGYNVRVVNVNIRLEAGYPDVPIDMAYFHPALSRLDGKAIGALAEDTFDGKAWQRWSRHRTGLSAWRIGTDNVQSHMALVGDWLSEELSK